ncbi:hypothetical protein BDR03DRAFT_1009020 [Suillus americanus]|nr:hypothetical protein BDR03DRAFT_1009020 [Suillus americanus]
MSPAEFESPSYRHCGVLRKLASASARSVASSVAFRMDQFPSWLSYADDTLLHILSSLSVPILAQCSLLLGSKVKHASKAKHVQHILQSFQTARSKFNTVSPDSAVDRLSDIELPLPCGCSLLPLLSVHFVNIFGACVADALWRPPPVSYAVLSPPLSLIPWLSFSTEVLVILEFEYGPSLVHRLSLQDPSPAEQLKLKRREQKQLHIRDQAQMSLERQQQWPTHVPKETVLSCLHHYYEGSVWTQPPPSALNLEKAFVSMIPS